MYAHTYIHNSLSAQIKCMHLVCYIEQCICLCSVLLWTTDLITKVVDRERLLYSTCWVKKLV